MPSLQKFANILPDREELYNSARPQIFAVAIIVLCSAAAQALSPLGLRTTVNGLTHKDVYQAMIGIASYAVMLFVARGAQAILNTQFGEFWRPIRKTAWIHAYRSVIEADHRVLGRKNTGEISQMITDGLVGLRTMLRSFVFGLIPTLIQGTVILLVIFYLGHFEFLLAIAGFALLYGLAFHSGTRQQIEAQRKAVDADTRTAGLGSEIIYGRESARLLGIRERLVEKLKSALESSEQHWAISSEKQRNNQIFLIVIFVLFLGASLCVCAYKVSTGVMNVGDFILINAYMLQVMAPVERLSASSREFFLGQTRLENLSTFLSQQNDLKSEPAGGKFTDPSSPTLSIDNLAFGYETDRQVIRGANLRIEAGKTIAIVGRSGSGKSTLWRIICNLLQPASGSIDWNGVQTKDLDPNLLKDSIAVAQQENTMYSATLLENITLWAEDFSDVEIDEILEAASLKALINRLPKGVNTPIGERGYRLSGGERQRVALARAMFRKPRLLILDEATSALDAETENFLLTKITENHAEATIIIITHKLSTIRNVDQIFVLHDGVITENGSHEELLALSGMYSAMWTAQSSSNI